ncbi:hypothetical protein SGPA1_20531 [Streptomyces misionensis JCM 4497]
MVRGRRRRGHVQAVVVVELEFLFGGEVAAHAEVGGVLDQGTVEGDVQGAVDEFAGFQGDEGVPGEEAGAYGRPLGHAGRIVQIHLVDRADLRTGAVERLAADQVAWIDVGLHGPSPSTWSQLIRKHYERALSPRRPLEEPAVDLAGRLIAAADPVRESPPTTSEAPKEQILPGISQAHVPHGRGHSGKQGGCRRLPLSPTVKAGAARRPVKLSGRDDRGGGRRGTRAVVPFEGRVRPGGLRNDRPSHSALRARSGHPLRTAPHRPRPGSAGQDARAGRLRLPGRADRRRGPGCDQERRRARPAGRPHRGRGARRAALARRPQPGPRLHDRPRLPRHLHPAGHPAQRHGEPVLVHGLHALPAGDLPGPPGGPAELPDHGRRPDRPAHLGRLPAGRGHGRRRGHGAVPAHGQEQEGPVPGRRGRPPADRRRDPDPRRADRRRGRRRRPQRGHPGRHRRPGHQRRAGPVPGRLRCRTRHQAADRAGPRAGRPGHRRRRSARPHPADLPGRAGRGHRRRHHPALRRPDGLRRAARGLHGGAREVRPQPARPPGRRVRRRRRQQGLPAGPADPRAAHPPREGHQQHLYRAGAARRHGRHVRRLPRSRGPADDRPAHPPVRRDPRRGPEGRRRGAAARRVLRHRHRPGARQGRRDRRRRPGQRRQPAPRRRRPRLHGLRRDHHAGAPGRRLVRLRRRGRHRGAGCERRRRAARGAAARRRLPHPSGLPPAPLRDRHAALPAQAGRPRLRARPRHDPAGLLHHEAQRDHRDGAGHLAGVRRAAPLRARRAGRGLPHAHPRAGGPPGRGHRLRQGLPPAQRRLPGRAGRSAGGPRLPPRQRRRGPHGLPHPVLRARHQRRQRRDGRHEGRRRQDRRGRRDRRRGPAGQDRAVPRRAGGADDHLPVHARCVRGARRRHLRPGARGRRPGVRRRRQPQRAGGPRQAGPLRRRRLAPQPAQDVLHPARRRRSRRRPGGGPLAPGAVPAQPPVAAGGGPGDGRGPGLGGAVGLGGHPADLLGVRPPDGRRGPQAGHPGGRAVRQLHRQAAGAALPGALHRPRRPGRARVHHRPAPADQGHRRERGRRGQAPDRLRLPRADHVVPGGRHADDRAHRVRGHHRAGPVLRRDDRDSHGDREGRLRRLAGGRQPAAQRAAHRGRARRRVDARLQPRGGRLPGRCVGGRQVLAAGAPHRPGLRRPQPGLLLPAAGRVRGLTGPRRTARPEGPVRMSGRGPRPMRSRVPLRSP